MDNHQMAGEGCAAFHHTGPYFNMGTYVVVEIIISSLYPHKAKFIEKIAQNSDM